jgi:hypothetical protein
MLEALMKKVKNTVLVNLIQRFLLDLDVVRAIIKN